MMIVITTRTVVLVTLPFADLCGHVVFMEAWKLVSA